LEECQDTESEDNKVAPFIYATIDLPRNDDSGPGDGVVADITDATIDVPDDDEWPASYL
jgi:hypothetical protein